MKKLKTQTRQTVSCPTRTSVPRTEARVISKGEANVRWLCRIPKPSCSSTRFVTFPYSPRENTQRFPEIRPPCLTSAAYKHYRLSDDTVQPGSLVPSSFLIIRVGNYPNNADGMFLQNVGTNVLDNTASNPEYQNINLYRR
jgi:hypothetical protein